MSPSLLLFLDSRSDDSPSPKQEKSCTTLASLFIFPVVLLGMITETLVSMIVNTVESFYPNFYSLRYGKQEGYVGTVMAISGLMYCIATIKAGRFKNTTLIHEQLNYENSFDYVWTRLLLSSFDLDYLITALDRH